MATITGTANADNLLGTGSDDLINGLGGDDVIDGGDGADTITGGTGLDLIAGGNGDDVLVISSYADVVAGESYDGGAGIDTLDLTAFGLIVAKLDLTGVTISDVEVLDSGYSKIVRLAPAQLLGFSTVTALIELSAGGTIDLAGKTIQGTSILLSDAATTLNLSGVISPLQTGYAVYGGLGNDVITGSGAYDLLLGGDGDDQIFAGIKDDTLLGGTGVDLLSGGNGNDVFQIFEQAEITSGDTLDGGDGFDTIDIQASQYNYEPIDLTVATISGIEALIQANDFYYGVKVSAAQLNGFDKLRGFIWVEGTGNVDLAGADLTGVLFKVADSVGTFSLAGSVGDTYSINAGDAANVIVGGAGFDRVSAAGGNDTVFGGGGQDLLYGEAGDDTLYGDSGDDSLFGGDGVDHLFGGDGDDALLIGNSTLHPSETFDGGAGFDRIIFDGGDVNLADVTFESIEGIQSDNSSIHATISQISAFDYVYATIVITDSGSISFAGKNAGGTFYLSDLGNSIDLSTQLGSVVVYGGLAADTIIGASTSNAPYGNRYYGEGGDDLLIGGDKDDALVGGTGLDALVGGAGDDLYHVDNAGDLVFENPGEGNDTVVSTDNFYLYANIETLVIRFDAGDKFGVGNELDNIISGSDGDNLLLGGLGDDTISGASGNDVIYGEDGADRLFGGSGIDAIVGGAGDDFLYGEDNADALYGGDGNDTIDGGGSFDTDILIGGNGDDVLYALSVLGPDYDLIDGGDGNDNYWVDTGDDLTFEAANGGIDTVHAIVNVPNAGVYLYANVENLILEGVTAFGVGNELNNIMTGSGTGNWLLGGLGNDLINGKEGNDVLFGEGGADTFVFEAGTGGDVIGDFQAGTDRINLVGYGLDFAALQTLFAQVGNVGAIQMLNGDVIVLHNVTMASLSAADFVFG